MGHYYNSWFAPCRSLAIIRCTYTRCSIVTGYTARVHYALVVFAKQNVCWKFQIDITDRFSILEYCSWLEDVVKQTHPWPGTDYTESLKSHCITMCVCMCIYISIILSLFHIIHLTRAQGWWYRANTIIVLCWAILEWYTSRIVFLTDCQEWNGDWKIVAGW